MIRRLELGGDDPGRRMDEGERKKDEYDSGIVEIAHRSWGDSIAGANFNSEEGSRSALVVNWTYCPFCMVRGKFNMDREPLGDFSALHSPKRTSVNSEGV